MLVHQRVVEFTRNGESFNSWWDHRNFNTGPRLLSDVFCNIETPQVRQEWVNTCNWQYIYIYIYLFGMNIHNSHLDVKTMVFPSVLITRSRWDSKKVRPFVVSLWAPRLVHWLATRHILADSDQKRRVFAYTDHMHSYTVYIHTYIHR